MSDSEPRKYTYETGIGRMDTDGVIWFACDPYPTWFRWKGKRLIHRHQRGAKPWKDGQPK